MADKNAKRKAFDIPVLDDIDEVIQVTPVFTRRTKTRNPEQSKTRFSKSENTETVQKLIATKSSDKNERISAPCSGQSDPEKARDAETETIQIDTGEARQSKRSKPSDKSAGKNFVETFAFIENTKYYEAAETTQTKASTSKDISETV